MTQLHRNLLDIIVLAVFVMGMSAPAAGASDAPGEGVSMEKTTPVSRILEDPDSHVGKGVRVDGLIVDVCSRRGCWMELASDRPYEKLRIKVHDSVIVFPMSPRGVKASVQGTVEAIKMTEEAIWFHRHQAEERGASFDSSTVRGPETIYQIRASGAQVHARWLCAA